MKLRLATLTLITAALFAAGGASAQTNAEVNAGLQFNFSTPGARSLGLGGAFIGLADDATAAFTNPAGLTILRRPEVSLEGRSWTYTHETPVEGRTFGAATGIGVDARSGLRSRDFEDDVSAPSFASFVYPRDRWAVALYRHVLADFEARVETQGPFFETTAPASQFRFLPIRAAMDLEIVAYGASGAFRLTDRLSLGIGAAYYELEMDSLTRRFALEVLPAGDPGEGAPGTFFGPPDFAPANVANSQTQTGDDDDVAVIAGLLWQASPRWSFGAVYRQGPSFDFEARSVAGAASQVPGDLLASQTAEFNVPDVWGVGTAFRPTDAFTVTLDYDHVEYSALTENVINVFALPADTTPEDRAAIDRLEIDDANEVHLGLEYVFLHLRNPLAVRLGAYYDPDHKMAFQGAPDGSPEQRSLATIFRAGDDEYHYSVGLGAVFGNFQVDAAADFSDLLETFSLSGVYRF